MSLPPDLTDAETVALIYDETDGLGFYAEFGLVDWNRDGEELLREVKPAYYDCPPRPRVSPLSERLAEFAKRRSAETMGLAAIRSGTGRR